MLHDDESVGTILSRRDAIRIAARAGLTIAGLGGVQRWAGAVGRTQAPDGVHLIASPMLTEGPFFVDENLNRSDLIAGSKRRTVKDGVPLHLTFTVLTLNGDEHAALAGAHVDVWHADAAGVYSDESNPMNHEDTSHQAWLRGYQATDHSGAATFKTIFPGWYPGRTPHIHFKIRTYSRASRVTAEFTSQVFLKDADARRILAGAPYVTTGRDTSNANDSVYNQKLSDGSLAGDQMLLDLKSLSGSAGYSAGFTVVLNHQNMHAGRRDRPGGPGGPGGPPPGGFGPPPGPPPPGGFGGPPR